MYFGILCCVMLLTCLSFADKIVNLIFNGPQSPTCSDSSTLNAWWTPTDNSCTFHKSIYFPLTFCSSGPEFNDASGNVGLEMADGNPHCNKFCCCWSIQGPDIQVRVNDACTTGNTPVWVTSSDCDY